MTVLTVFIATGAAVFHGARLGKGSEVRINGVVPSEIVRPSRRDRADWMGGGGRPRQNPSPRSARGDLGASKPLNFPLFVYGVDRAEADMVKITKGLSDALQSHRDDSVVS